MKTDPAYRLVTGDWACLGWLLLLLWLALKSCVVWIGLSSMHWGRRLCAIIRQALDRHRCFDWGLQSSQQRLGWNFGAALGGVGQLCSWRPMTVMVHDWTSTSNYCYYYHYLWVTSGQRRLPAGLKHITKRRKRN